MKLDFSGQIFEKYSNTKFHKNPSIVSQVAPRGRIDGRTYIHTYIHTYTYIPAYIRTYTYTYTHDEALNPFLQF